MKRSIEGNIKIVLYGLIVAAVVAVSPFLYINLQHMKYDSVRINLAGRQRMVTQKLMKEMLLFQAGFKTDENIRKTALAFSTAIRGLIDGGKVPHDITMTAFDVVPPLTDKRVREHLLLTDEKWIAFSRYLDAFLAGSDRKTLTYLLDRGDEVLAALDEAVFAMQYAAEQRGRRMQALSYSIVALIVFVLSIDLVIVIRNLRSAEKKIDDLEKFIPMCSSCKRIRIDNDHPEDQKSWISLEDYLKRSGDGMVTHGICPDCADKLYPGFKRR